LANVRIRGKIRHDEWPKIAERFQKGETLTEIARSYHCTAPAIRYIVQRTLSRGGRGMKLDKGERASIVPLPSDRRTANRLRMDADVSRTGRGPDPKAVEIWGRINNDVAVFLAAVDAVAAEDSEHNFEALLAATDRLLWASARTRLEVERVLDEKRKGAGSRRMSG
jgi:hypothetical protein